MVFGKGVNIMRGINYSHKLAKIKILELTTYQELEEIQKAYEARLNFYKEKKDEIGIKIRMLEVYQNLWEDVDLQIGEQAFLNEEFWHNISFNILKYSKFIQELNEQDYSIKTKNALDKKVNKELWDEREQAFILMKNDIHHMYTDFNKMHSKLHKRSILQRECIEKHIVVMETKCREAEANKEQYRSVFHEIRNDIGIKGNKFSRQALENYKISILEKAEQAQIESEPVKFELAW